MKEKALIYWKKLHKTRITRKRALFPLILLIALLMILFSASEFVAEEAVSSTDDELVVENKPDKSEQTAILSVSEKLDPGKQIKWQVVCSGGFMGEATQLNRSPGLVVDGTVGQTAIGIGSSPSFGVGHGFWAGLIEISPPPPVCDTVSLNPGWQWISSNIDPFIPDMESVFVDIADKIGIVIACDGTFYIPGVGNWIGNWKFSEMYKVYMLPACGQNEPLEICGYLIPPSTPLALKLGWNCISYLPEVATPVVDALYEIEGCLNICKNDEGEFYIPGVINTIGLMLPGEGYKVHMKCVDTLIYPVPTPGPPLHTQKSTSVSEVLTVSHFDCVPNTGETHSIVINSIRGWEPEMSDEIGVFTPSGLCVGAVVWQGYKMGLAAWQDNPQTENIDGYKPDERMAFRLWDKSENKEIDLTADYSRGDGTFGEGPYAIVNLKAIGSVSSSPNLPTSFSLSQNYPNPFNPICEIQYALPKDCHVQLNIFNILGQKVRALVDEYQNAGYKSVKWDGEDDQEQKLASGVYFYRIRAEDFVQSKKMMLMK